MGEYKGKPLHPVSALGGNCNTSPMSAQEKDAMLLLVNGLGGLKHVWEAEIAVKKGKKWSSR